MVSVEIGGCLNFRRAIRRGNVRSYASGISHQFRFAPAAGERPGIDPGGGFMVGFTVWPGGEGGPRRGDSAGYATNAEQPSVLAEGVAQPGLLVRAEVGGDQFEIRADETLPDPVLDRT